MTSEFETLLSAAIWAPSGDNTQPWQIAVDAVSGTVAFRVEEGRDPSPMNAGQRMARIAIGAAVENLLQAAGARGWEARPDLADASTVASVQLTRGQGPQRGEVDILMRARVTNRRVYDQRPVPVDLLAELTRQTPPLEAVRTCWIAGADRLKPLAELIGRADATMFGEPSMRAAFLSRVRFDLPPEAQAEEGLPLSALEVGKMDRTALRLMRRLPQWLLRSMGGLRVFAAKARQLVESASGLCLVVAPDRSPRTDLLVGRAMQRAWLALSGAGLAVQPMMSLPVLENVLEHGAPAVVASLGREKVEALGADFRKLAPEVGGGRPGFLMRFGYAPAPTGRTGRLPLRAVVQETAPAAGKGDAHEPSALGS